MKKTQCSLAILSLAFAIVFSACTDSTGSGDQNVSFVTEFTGESVMRSMPDKSSAQIYSAGQIVDSLRVSRARILVSSLKMHGDKVDDKHVDGDCDVKVGPFLLTAEPGKNLTLTAGTVPAGTYDHIKFEIHKFTGSEYQMYLNDPIFRDFVDQNRYTVIIDGVYWVDGKEYPFTYQTDLTANLMLHFANDITIGSPSDNIVIVIQIDPSLVFRTGFVVLNPLDMKNKHDIDAAIKLGIKSFKRM